jgi:hypothetical protein
MKIGRPRELKPHQIDRVIAKKDIMVKRAKGKWHIKMARIKRAAFEMLRWDGQVCRVQKRLRGRAGVPHGCPHDAGCLRHTRPGLPGFCTTDCPACCFSAS